jgi:ABC-type multidrug transport system fused ATPase/permease subunit
MGAFIAGLGGAMLAYSRPAVTPQDFTILVGIALFATVYLAGITSVSGGLLAGLLAASGVVFRAFDQWLDIGDWYQTLLGVGLVLTVVKNPEGLVGPVHVLLNRRRMGDEPPEHKPSVATLVAQPALRAPGRTLLAIQDIRVQYGGVVAVDNVSFNVTSGSIVGLIGPNGAGKTTLVDAITGFADCSGTVILAGNSLKRLPPHLRVRAGLGRTFQHAELYEDLSVIENVIVGLAGAGKRKVARELDPTLEPPAAGLDRSGIGGRSLPAAARRAGRWSRLDGEPMAGRAAATDPRERNHHLDDRPRHEPCAQRVRRDPGTRLRPHHRQRAAQRGQD